jgi:transposase-like protein
MVQESGEQVIRFTLSYRDVEDLLAKRGLEITNETIRRWVMKFGSAVARNLRHARPVAHDRWHLDEMVVSIAGRQMYMWRAVDGEGEVLDVLVQPRRDKAAALKLLRKLLKRQRFAPTVIVTDKLARPRRRKESRETRAESTMIMPMTVWRRHCNRHAFLSIPEF